MHAHPYTQEDKNTHIHTVEMGIGWKRIGVIQIEDVVSMRMRACVRA